MAKGGAAGNRSQARRRKTRLPYKCVFVLCNLRGIAEGFRKGGFCYQPGVCAQDRSEQRLNAARLVRFIQVSCLEEQGECNSTHHILSPAV